MESALGVRSWLPRYEISWLRSDLVAGLTLAAYLLPAGIGDASLAGLAPEGCHATRPEWAPAPVVIQPIHGTSDPPNDPEAGAEAPR
jgi:hypothetical protein